MQVDLRLRPMSAPEQSLLQSARHCRRHRKDLSNAVVDSKKRAIQPVGFVNDRCASVPLPKSRRITKEPLGVVLTDGLSNFLCCHLRLDSAREAEHIRSRVLSRSSRFTSQTARDVYQYDTMPEALQVQIVRIIGDAFRDLDNVLCKSWNALQCGLLQRCCHRYCLLEGKMRGDGTRRDCRVRWGLFVTVRCHHTTEAFVNELTRNGFRAMHSEADEDWTLRTIATI